LPSTCTAKLVPRTPRIAVGVRTFMASGELRAMSPIPWSAFPCACRVSILPLKLLESKVYSASAASLLGPERQHGIVAEGQADRAVGVGLQHVLLVERIARLAGMRLPSRTTKTASRRWI